MVSFLLSYKKAFTVRYPTTHQKWLRNRGLRCLAAFGNRIGYHGVFISNVTCVCVMYIFSLTGMTGFKEFGLWRKLWLCSVNSGMLQLTNPNTGLVEFILERYTRLNKDGQWLVNRCSMDEQLGFGSSPALQHSSCIKILELHR